MHKLSIVLLTLLLLCLGGCDNKSDNDTQTATTHMHTADTNNTLLTTTFTLQDTHAKEHNLTAQGNNLAFEGQEKPIVLVNFFATWCEPCVGEITYLNTLQKKYRNKLFVAGVLTHDDITKDALQTFLHTHRVSYTMLNTEHNTTFATQVAKSLGLDENFSIPLIIMYINGNYFTHYEGSVPVEMIEYDIEQAKKQYQLR